MGFFYFRGVKIGRSYMLDNRPAPGKARARSNSSGFLAVSWLIACTCLAGTAVKYSCLLNGLVTVICQHLTVTIPIGCSLASLRNDGINFGNLKN